MNEQSPEVLIAKYVKMVKILMVQGGVSLVTLSAQDIETMDQVISSIVTIMVYYQMMEKVQTALAEEE